MERGVTQARIADLHQDMLRLAEAQAVAAKYAQVALAASLADLVEDLAVLVNGTNMHGKGPE